MDIRSLRYFIAAANLKSISKAAEHLHIAQPALSRQLRKLEADLKVELFHRDARGVRLTDAGTLLLEKAESLIRQFEHIAEEVRRQSRNPSGHVSVALIPSVASFIALPLIERMRERHPKISLRISEGLTTAIVSGLLEHKFDFGLIPAEQGDASLISIPLLIEPMFLIGPADKASTDNKPLSLQQLSQYPLILPSRGNTLREQIESVAKRNGVALDVRESVDSAIVTKQLVIAGLGYTIHCYSFVHAEVTRGQLFVQPLRSQELVRQWSLARPRDHSQSEASSKAAKVLLEIATEFSQQKDWYLQVSRRQSL
ncbi:MAG: LysR family transcriptional regulator [Pseudomonadota bacterium]